MTKENSVLASSSSKTTIIGIINGKGGVGKTTTAVNGAAILAEKQEVLLVDADPQGSASWWTQRGKKGIDFDLTEENNPKILEKLRSIEDYEVIVVDTPPALRSEALKSAIACAD